MIRALEAQGKRGRGEKQWRQAQHGEQRKGVTRRNHYKVYSPFLVLEYSGAVLMQTPAFRQALTRL